MKKLTLCIALVLACAWCAHADAPPLDVLRSIPIQNQGRLKPLDTFARETVFSVTGKDAFQGRAPLDLMLDWIAHPDAARKLACIETPGQGVRDLLGYGTMRWVSLDDLLSNPKFESMNRALMTKEQQGGELSSLEKQEARLVGRANALSSICSGDAWTIIPDPQSVKNAWTSLASLTAAGTKIPTATAQEIVTEFKGLLDAYDKHDNPAFEEIAQKLKTTLAAVGPGPDPAIIQRELEYNDFAPFQKAWIIYVAALLVLSAGASLRNTKVYWGGYAIAVAGLIVHVYGFYLRCTIAGRPPVTNMYESIIWVSFGAMLFALILEGVYKGRSILMAATAVSTICLIIADNTSSVLDPAINPLTPVLRSNFWLTIHVLTITMSYAVFMLTMGLGHVSLWKFGFHPEDRQGQRALHQQLHKAVQIGVMLLAAGTILGGVWANYSWGRFWGWDPKEVWALIALLGYLSVLHGRFAGWLKDFGFSAGAVVAFCGVLMAWYGVNFVLGAGLHAYGFGNGGQQYVYTAVILDLMFVAAMGMRYKKWRALGATARTDRVE